MAQDLSGKRVAFLVANEGVEQAELTEPWQAVKAAGGQPELIAPSCGQVQAFNHLDKGDSFPVDTTIGEAKVDDYVGLVLPGGVANPDQLRTDDDALRFVQDWFEAGKPTAVICHGPWTLVSAGVINGRTLTSWPSVRTDIVNAGGQWVDEECHVDGNLISSRKPDDLAAFCAAAINAFAAQ